MTQFTVDSDQVMAANANIQITISKLSNEVQLLHGQLQGLQASWTGLAATSFQELASRWRVTAGAVEAQLAELGSALGMAAQQYSDIELSNQRLFL
ncbi:WXG100 family type VII secretion target [Rhodoluna sp. KAS3]|jgi:WXG100 family type VII secretion target|uniref:WXG100 family type VII secretion target n=1 Tax=Rhodoluna sp. KAS3 TaxID=942880 RepID=UPI002232B404|nr:WXG100 family type VII secretion target [Rhodoluna sp. KAS3]BDS49410.1 hypothetical protein RKAS3_09870 [Rhodoluna sp. KAS3]